MSAVETIARVFMVITCCTFVSAAYHPSRNNLNPLRNIRNQYFPRHGLATYQQGRYYQDGYFDDQNPNPGCPKTLTKADCPLFDYRSSIVNRDDFVSAVSSEPRWFNIYSKEIGTENYGKCQLRFESPDANGDFVQREQCFDIGKNECVDLTISARLEEDECGVLKLQGVNDSTVETIHSQDINQYYLRDICVNKQGEDCAGGRFIDVNVSGSRLVERSDSSSSSSSESGHETDLAVFITIYRLYTVGNVLQYRVFQLQYRILKMEDYLLGGQTFCIAVFMFLKKKIILKVIEYKLRSDNYNIFSSEPDEGLDDGDNVDLTGVPWDLISADLKNIYNIDFADPEMRYVFVGIECPT